MKPYRSASFLGFLLIVGMFLLFGCGGGGGGGDTPVITGTPQVTASASEILFGNQVVNQTSERPLTVSNVGTANLSIGTIAGTNPLSAPFSIASDTCSGQTLVPNGTCRIDIRFVPTAQGILSDSFDIPTNDRNLTVNASGNGQGLDVRIISVESALPEIKLLVSVTDGNNNPITGLVSGNFTVTEQGQGVSISAVNNASTRPLSVALALDYSGSTAPVLDAIEASASTFIGDLNLPDDEAAVIKFANRVQLMTDVAGDGFSSDIVELQAAIAAPYNFSTTGTQFFGAVNDSVTLLGPRNQANRKAAIVVSDGRDEGIQSQVGLEEVIASAQEKGVAVYTIGLGLEELIDTAVLMQLADETGGQYLPSPSENDLDQVYADIVALFANQYEITFTTTKSAGTVNELTVAADDGINNGSDTVSVTY